MRGVFLKCHLFLLTLSAFTLSSGNDLIHEQLRFKYLNVDNGLTNNRVRGLVQDHYGYIWMGTRKGVSRFDGYKIDQYHSYITDTNHLYFSETRGLLCDSRNTIWVTGVYGICFYNWTDNAFYAFEHPGLGEGLNYCGGVDEDNEGNLWFSSNLGLIKYNPTDNNLFIIKQENNNPMALPEGTLEKVRADSRNNIWFGYLNEGAGYYNPKNKMIRHFTSGSNEKSLAGNRVEQLYEDKKGNIWIGHYNNGISKYNYSKNTFEHFFPQSELKESGRVRAIAEDPQGNFWFGTMAGLYLFNKNNGTFNRYAYAQHPISILSHNSIQDILIDSQEGMWLGTHSGGVSYTNLNVSGFIKYEYSNIPSPFFLNDKSVYSLAFDNKNNIWVGTENGGLNYLDRQTGRFTYYTYDPNNPNSPNSNNIKDIKIDHENNVWFGSYKGGLSKYDPVLNRFRHFSKSQDNPNGLDKETVYCLSFDPRDENMLWVGTIDGVYIMDIKKSTFTRVMPGMLGFENVPEISGWIYTLYVSGNYVMIGADKLSIVNRADNTFRTFSVINDIPVTEIDFILTDKNQDIWFGINSIYIARYFSGKNEFKVYGPDQGLPIAEFLEAEDDYMGNLWVSSSKGILKLENVIHQPDSFAIRTYDNSDNLQSLEFIYHSKAESPSGEILFGGINGFNSFKPDNVRVNPYKPNVEITQLVIANKEVGAGEKVYGRELLKKPLIETNFIKFHHKIKTFTLHFTAFHFVAPENNRFAYKLEGFDKEWNYTGANVRFATYSNIKSGKYTFLVKASNNNDQWSDVPVALDIKVTPPFWRTYWFYGLITLILGSLVFAFIKWREKQILHDKLILEEKLDKGNEEIEESKKKVLKQGEELKKRDMAEQQQRWHNEGAIKINEIITLHKGNSEDLAKHFLIGLLEYLGAQQGAVYMLNDDDPDHKYLEQIAAYGLPKSRTEAAKVEIGENLIGTCFKDNEIMNIDDIPKGFAQIETGIGYSSLNSLLLMPLKQEEIVLGVVEIASMKGIETFEVHFIETVNSTFASNLFTSITNRRMQQLLQLSQQQTEEMKAQEEEMRQNLEEMHATQDEAERREQELMKLNEEMKEKERNFNQTLLKLKKEFNQSLKQKEEYILKIKKEAKN
jgi:ligand-binding sensor domain-containing protein